jgi:exopolysaccharide production protein ExoY
MSTRVRWLLSIAEDQMRRDIDVIGAMFCLILTAPLLLIIGLFVVLDGGPLLFSHRRVGRHGLSFNCLKFRTMMVGAEECLTEYLHYAPEARSEWLRDHKLRVDPRITPVGRFLRRTSLDELPQMWNVLRGDMSLVGPRPVTELEMREHYGRNARVVTSVRPGVTGIWQISGRSDTDYPSRVRLDTSYVVTRRLVTDLNILAQTLPVVIARKGAH